MRSASTVRSTLWLQKQMQQGIRSLRTWQISSRQNTWKRASLAEPRGEAFTPILIPVLQARTSYEIDGYAINGSQRRLVTVDEFALLSPGRAENCRADPAPPRLDHLECEFSQPQERRTAMKGTRHSEEQISTILKQGEAGVATAELCRQHGISEKTYYRWKAKYGGIDCSEAKWLKQ